MNWHKLLLKILGEGLYDAISVEVETLPLPEEVKAELLAKVHAILVP